MTVQDIVNLITTVGFPIAVTIYLLYERAKLTNSLTNEIAALKRAIELLTEFMKGERNNDKG